ncbi:MAG: SUMF1/EgtB/PvdO family nonheme iron enzyme [Deltaproteobacteria bacterium]|nr:SUMF1/EgtB/PvdO family nonheme iron enzyme [Deltaproteobacteria bacterium]
MTEEKVGDYEIIGSLGRGGFGSVYKARAPSGNIVAMKVLNPQVLDNQKVVKKFFHEAMILAKLDHPNICQLIEFFPDSDNYAIVMEYVPGTELKELMKEQENGLLPFDHAFRIAKQSLDAFQYAHEAGILHRDIKPANIMIDQNGNCKIMDFGIAKMAGAATHDTAASMLSVHYTPPERFDPSGTVDSRSDVYALGLVFYELFAGRKPFEADETSQIMFWHLNEIPESPDEYVEGLPKEVSDAINIALEKDPDDRYQDFREFSDAMGQGDPDIDYTAQLTTDSEATMIGGQTVITSAVESKKLKKPRRGRKKGVPVPVVAGIAVAVIVLLAAGFFAYTKLVPREQPGVTALTEKKPLVVPEKPVEVTHPKDNSIMTLIPEGAFTMGSDAWDAEKPMQPITLDKYYIDKYLVTNKLFQKFVEETSYVTDAEKDNSGMVRMGRRWKKVPDAMWKMPDGATSIEGKEDHPVSQVSYNDALAYCQWANKDLPTEAQWEKAARGPNGNEFPWGNSDPDDTMANFENMIESTSPVTDYEKGKSVYGIQDMAGNVYQWCKDWYGTGERAAKNPTGPESGKERVIKGGSFLEGMESLRSANRDRYKPDYSSFLFGFRCACEEVK